MGSWQGLLLAIGQRADKMVIANQKKGSSTEAIVEENKETIAQTIAVKIA